MRNLLFDVFSLVKTSVVLLPEIWWLFCSTIHLRIIETLFYNKLCYNMYTVVCCTGSIIYMYNLHCSVSDYVHIISYFMFRFTVHFSVSVDHLRSFGLVLYIMQCSSDYGHCVINYDIILFSIYYYICTIVVHYAPLDCFMIKYYHYYV